MLQTNVVEEKSWELPYQDKSLALLLMVEMPGVGAVEKAEVFLPIEATNIQEAVVVEVIAMEEITPTIIRDPKIGVSLKLLLFGVKLYAPVAYIINQNMTSSPIPRKESFSSQEGIPVD